MELRRDLTLVVRAPAWMSDQDIDSFLRKKEGWVETHLAQARARSGQALPKLTAEEVVELVRRGRQVIPQRAAWFGPLVGVDWGRITVRRQVSRWGSCSAKGNLNFNCLLMLCPPEVLDYVVVHELCHRKHMNHSQAFWAEVGRVLPDYKVRRAWLKERGGALIDRLEP